MRIALLTIFLAKAAYCLLGYDCGGASLNMTTISLLNVAECNYSISEPNSTSVNIVLLQKKDFIEVKTKSCRIEIDRQIFHCGMFSHISMVSGGHKKYIFDVGRRKCDDLHDGRTLDFLKSLNYHRNFNTIIELPPNSTTHRNIYLAGKVKSDGSCQGDSFSDEFGTWDDVVVEASITITLRDYLTSANTELDYIKLRSGVQCKLSHNQCNDEDGANVFWSSLPVDKCKFKSYDILYKGLANKISDSSSQYPIVYSLTTKDTTFALSKRDDNNICGYILTQTEHPKLVIVEITRNNPFRESTHISISNLDIFAYINSKFVYVEKHIRTQMQKLYHNVIDQKCRLEREVLKNAISLAQNQPDVFAYNVMKRPGYLATISGEVAHIIKCVSTEVVRRKTEHCYLELPITLLNRSMYLSPKTHIILNKGTPIDCNPLLPIMYKIREEWISLTPKLAVVQPAMVQMLEPMTQPTWQYIDAEYLAESGIYSNEDLTKLRNHIMFPMETSPLLNTLAQTAAGHRVPLSGISFTNLLDEEALDKIASSAGKRLWGNFMKFGTASAGCIGIWILLRLIKLITDTAIHGYTLHSVYGWSIHLLGAIFSSITSLLLHLEKTVPQSSRSTDSEPLEKLTVHTHNSSTPIHTSL